MQEKRVSSGTYKIEPEIKDQLRRLMEGVLLWNVLNLPYLRIYRSAHHVDFDHANSKRKAAAGHWSIKIVSASLKTLLNKSHSTQVIKSDEVSNHSLPLFKTFWGKQVTHKGFLAHQLEEWSLDTDWIFVGMGSVNLGYWSFKH